MNDEENQEQQSSLDDNPVSQVEQQAAARMAQQVQNVARNAMNAAKKTVTEVAKKAGKAITKAAMNLGKLIIRGIIATAPVSLIVIAVLVIALLILAVIIAAYNGITTLLANDLKSGDISTIEENASLYDSDYIDESVPFSVSANAGMATNAKELHSYIRAQGYTYDSSGQKMTYPRSSNKVIDCSSFVTWVIIQQGYTEFENNRQLNSRDFIWYAKGEVYNYDLKKYGWQVIAINSNTVSSIEAGDVLVAWDGQHGHVEVFAGSGVGTYGAGSNHQIQAEISYKGCSTSTIVSKGNFKWAVRVTKKVMSGTALNDDDPDIGWAN